MAIKIKQSTELRKAIKALRKELGELGDYWGTFTQWLRTVERILENQGFKLPEYFVCQVFCEAGRSRIPLTWGGMEIDNDIIFTWYSMPSGERYEVITYLS